MQLLVSLILILVFALVGMLMFSRYVSTDADNTTGPPMSLWLRILGSILVVLLLIHVLVEGFRWQMVPAYVVSIVALVVAWVRTRRGNRPRAAGLGASVAAWTSAIVATALIGLSALSSYAFPVFELGKPTGEYPVGTTQLHLVDEDRHEQYASDADTRRELMVRIWYPAELNDGDTSEPYWRSAVARSTALTSNTPLPWFTFTHLNLVKTHSYRDAPIAKRQAAYPVVLYSHGVGLGWASGNTKLAEGLASHGYIVVGIDHAYIGSLSIFPDGRLVTFDKATRQAMNQKPPAEVESLQKRMSESEDWQEQIRLFEDVMALVPEPLSHVTKAMDTQVADQRFVIDELGRLQRRGHMDLASRLDLQRIAIMGISLGGCAALETCAVDDRCKAGVNLDGFHPRHIGFALDTTPFLFMNSENSLVNMTNFLSARSPVYSAHITGATHFNFFDFSVMSPLYQALGVLGPIDGDRMLLIMETTVRGFLDRHLRGIGDEVPSPSETYPEVAFESRNAR